MADDSSSNTATVAIVVLVVAALFFLYFMFLRGGDDADITIDLPDVGLNDSSGAGTTADPAEALAFLA